MQPVVKEDSKFKYRLELTLCHIPLVAEVLGQYIL